MSSLNILKRAEAGHDPKTVGHLNRIRRSLTHLVGLVGDLLDAGQLQSGHFALRTREVSLASLAEDTVAEMRPLAEAKSQVLTTSLDPALPALQADGGRVAQVIRNLLHNAIRYTPASGRVHLSLAMASGALRCEVSDDGPGIDPAAMPHLFERFRQAQSQTSDGDQGVGSACSSPGRSSRPTAPWASRAARRGQHLLVHPARSASNPTLPRGAGSRPAGRRQPTTRLARRRFNRSRAIALAGRDAAPRAHSARS